MQEALPYKTWLPSHHQETILQNRSPSLMNQKNSSNEVGSTSIHVRGAKNTDFLKNLVTEKPVIVFARRGCCMSHVIKRLLQGQGINPAVYEVDEQDENDVVDELEKMAVAAGDQKEGRVQFPVVFIGGRLFGGLDRIIATHITGELIPVLKQAGALWL